MTNTFPRPFLSGFLLPPLSLLPLITEAIIFTNSLCLFILPLNCLNIEIVIFYLSSLFLAPSQGQKERERERERKSKESEKERKSKERERERESKESEEEESERER